MNKAKRKNKRKLPLWIPVTASLLVLLVGFLLFRGRGAGRLDAALPKSERRMLEKSPLFVLYSLDPHPTNISAQDLKTKPLFHDNLILGQTRITNPKVREELLATLYSEVGNSNAAMCFNPRHGIRVMQGGKAIDLVICFECSQVEIYNGPAKHETTISRVPKAVFDRVLTEAKIPLIAPVP